MVANNIFPLPHTPPEPHRTIWTTFQKWLKTKLDDIIAPPRAKVLRATSQLVGSGVVSVIQWDSPTANAPYSYEKGGTFWSSGAPSRLTAPVSGWYHCEFVQQLDVNATGARFMGIFINGSVWIAQATGAGNSAFYWGGSVSTDVYLNAGDYIEGGVYHAAGVAINVINSYTIAMSIRRIATITP